MLTGEIEAGKVGVAKEVKNGETNKFFILASDMLDMRSAIIMIIGLFTFRGDGRDIFSGKISERRKWIRGRRTGL